MSVCDEDEVSGLNIPTITQALVIRRLQIANCCSAKKGYNYLKNYEEKGKSDQSKLVEIELVLAYIDSLVKYIGDYNGSPVLSSDRCLTDAQINNILNAMCKICDAPCTSYINFS